MLRRGGWSCPHFAAPLTSIRTLCFGIPCMATILSASHVAPCRGEPCTPSVLHAGDESGMQDQEAAEEQYVPELPQLDASAAPDELGAEDFGQSLAPQPRQIAAHLTLVIVAAALLLR